MDAVCFCIFRWVTQLPNEFINKKLKNFQDDRLYRGTRASECYLCLTWFIMQARKLFRWSGIKGMKGGEMEHGDDEKRLEIWEFQLFTHFDFSVLSLTDFYILLSVMLQELLSLTYLCLLEIKICQSTICSQNCFIKRSNSHLPISHKDQHICCNIHKNIQWN